MRPTPRAPRARSRRRQVDHEPGAARPSGRSSTHTSPPCRRMCSADQRKAQAHALAAGASTTGADPGEPVEDDLALRLGNARTVVLDGDPDAVVDQSRSHAASRRRRTSRRCRAGWRCTRTRRRLSARTTTPSLTLGVVARPARRRRRWTLDRLDDELGRRAPPRGRAGRRRRRSGRSRAGPRRAAGTGRRRPTAGRARLGALGHLVAAGLEHLDRRGQGHQRRPQLVAHVGREAGVALDAVLERLRPCR